VPFSQGAARRCAQLRDRRRRRGHRVRSLALDLVVSAPTAAAHTAASVGTEVWYLSVGLGWPQLGTAEYPWHPKTHVYWPEKFGDWDDVMPRLAGDLAAFAAK